MTRQWRSPRTRVSIHAPLRGATVHDLQPALGQIVSIHAPLRGATSGAAQLFTVCTGFNPRPSARGDEPPRSTSLAVPCFNPRPSARGDRHLRRRGHGSGGVSIHAPLRGATSTVSSRARTLRRFNPRPSARGDVTSPAYTGIEGWFQSTPLCEGRRQVTEGCVVGCGVSIHAPLRGATRTRHRQLVRTPCFNPRPSARGDLEPQEVA